MKSSSYHRSNAGAGSAVLARPFGTSIPLRVAVAFSLAFALAQGAHALNPQPLPPKPATVFKPGAVYSMTSRAAVKKPNPLPPIATGFEGISRIVSGQNLAGSGVLSVSSRNMLNPQPLPPRAAVRLSPASRIALNPQPLPPRIVMPSPIRFAFPR